LHKLTEGKHAQTKVIYNGVNSSLFIDNSYINPERKIILTVSQADNEIEYIRKGSNKFIKIAGKMPEYEFILTGLRGHALELAKKDGINVPNIKVLPGPLSLEKDIIPLYQKAAAYCQFSLEETFGLAVVESMACGCVPIVSSKGALPEVVGNAGCIADEDETIIDYIKKSLNLTKEERDRFRARAMDFDLANRKKELLNNLD
jgi:glycosyltransferase involved in cell wall biosynthesis